MTKQLLVLASDVSSTGGIERVVRQTVQAAADRLGHESVRLVAVHPAPSGRCGAVPVMAAMEDKESSARVSLQRQARFAALVLREAVSGRRHIAGVLCLHAGLASVARVAALVTGSPYAVAAYGVEVWGRIPPWDASALRHAEAVWSISGFTSQQLAQRHGIPARRVRPWVLGLQEPPGSRIPAPSGQGQNVLTVARLSSRDAYKGVDTLLMAWPHVLRGMPAANLEVIGSGDHLSTLQELAARLGIGEHVQFRGRVTDAERDAAYSRADVFALPGRARLGRNPEGEGLGLVFLEAQGRGLPVVVGNAGGAPEALQPGVTGLLVDSQDAVKVADAILSLLRDGDLRARMSLQAREWVLRERSAQAAHDSLDALLDSLLAAG